MTLNKDSNPPPLPHQAHSGAAAMPIRNKANKRKREYMNNRDSKNDNNLLTVKQINLQHSKRALNCLNLNYATFVTKRKRNDKVIYAAQEPWVYKGVIRPPHPDLIPVFPFTSLPRQIKR